MKYMVTYEDWKGLMHFGMTDDPKYMLNQLLEAGTLGTGKQAKNRLKEAMAYEISEGVPAMKVEVPA